MNPEWQKASPLRSCSTLALSSPALLPPSVPSVGAEVVASMNLSFPSCEEFAELVSWGGCERTPQLFSAGEGGMRVLPGPVPAF